MQKNITRRAFLKGGAAAACAAAATAVPASAIPASEEGQLATLLDLSRCVGCGECVTACRESHAQKFPEPEKPFPKMHPERVPVEDWSEKRDVTDRLTPYNWIYIQEAVVSKGDEEITVHIPRRCMHCVNPPCVKLCPWGAASQQKNGISKINADFCLGGSKCRKVCPWHIPQRQTGVGLYLDLLPSLAGNGVMYKCDRCYDKISKGELPACIDACPEGVQTIGPRDKIIEEAYRIAGETKAYVYGDRENGGTNTIYLSPVPFEELQHTVKKGKGQPGLGPEKDRMASANSMASALFIAPFAGIAVAAARLYLTGKQTTKEEK